MKKTSLFSVILLLFNTIQLSAQITDTLNKEFRFSVIKKLETTSVKDQANSGTCWAFATTSFIESELLKKTGKTYDISEMFFVKNAYNSKADKFVRYQGTSNFGQGGQAHDVMNCVQQYGMITEDAYPGLIRGEKKHLHAELEVVLKSMVSAIVSNPGKKISQVWKSAFNAVTDVYLGAIPPDFKVNGEEYNPVSFTKSTGLHPEDYLEITSYNHHPFYEQFILEIPDNWDQKPYYNVPLDELVEIVNNAIESGYTVCWDGDVSDKGFSHNKGVAVIPDIEMPDLSGYEKLKWEKLSDKEKQKQLFTFEGPVKERFIDQESRQRDFDNHMATDDHLMHITGMVKDQNGTIYYITKNSWNAESNENGGYLNMSESFVRLNTIAIMINKNAIPHSIAKKLNIK